MNLPKDKDPGQTAPTLAPPMHVYPLQSQPAATDPTTATAEEIEAAASKHEHGSEHHHLHVPSSDEIKGKWKQKIGAAKIAWGKFTHDELLEMEGHEQKMIGQVQERYAVTRDEAAAQVKRFLDQHKS